MYWVIAIAVAGGIWLGSSNSDLNTKLGQEQLKNASLAHQISSDADQYNALGDKYNTLTSEYADLRSKFESVADDPIDLSPPPTHPTHGSICNDGWVSSSQGSGTCSHHNGVSYEF